MWKQVHCRNVLPDGSVAEESTYRAGDLGSIPGTGRSLEKEGNGDPLQYSCLENPMDRGACWATVHGVTKNQTGLSANTVTFKALWEPRPTVPQLHTPHLCPLSSQAPPDAHSLSDTRASLKLGLKNTRPAPAQALSPCCSLQLEHSTFISSGLYSQISSWARPSLATLFNLPSPHPTLPLLLL